MSSEDALQRIYDDPAVVRAMAILKEHAITGEQYDELLKGMPPIRYDPHGFGCDCYHCLPLRPGISPPPSYDEATDDWTTVEMSDDELNALDPDLTRRIIERSPAKFIASPDLT